MANTFTTTTTVLRYGSIDFAGPNGKSLSLVRGSLVIDTAVGATPDDLPASLFGLTKILACPSLVSAAETLLVPAMPDTFGDSLLTAPTSTLGTGTKQVETATVVAAGGATGDGDIDLTITSALLDEAEVVTVTLASATHTTATLIAGAMRTALTANANIAANFTVGGSGAAVVLTAIVADANDATLNLAIEGTLGVTAVTSSVDTTAGAAPVYTGSSTPGVASDLALGTYSVTIIGY